METLITLIRAPLGISVIYTPFRFERNILRFFIVALIQIFHSEGPNFSFPSKVLSLVRLLGGFTFPT